MKLEVVAAVHSYFAPLVETRKFRFIIEMFHSHIR